LFISKSKSRSWEGDLKKIVLALFLAALFLGGCQTIPFQVKAPLESEGEVYLYVQTFPQDAERLRFSLEGIFAIGVGGAVYPFSISLRDFNNKGIDRQRLVATAVLPPGAYSGLSFKVKDAALRTEEGDANLLVPEQAVSVNFPFKVEKKKAMAISMQFSYAESIQGGFSFSPSFTMFIPDRPLISLMGFVSNSGSNSVMVFDKSTMQVTGAIATGSTPRGMAINQIRGRAFVALSGDDAVAVIDMASGDILNDIRLNSGDRPYELALTPDGKLLLVANNGSNTVSFIDTASSIETDRVLVGDGPQSIAIDQNGRRAFVFNSSASTISLIDIPSRLVLVTIASDPHPLRGQFNARGDRLYVINSGSPYLIILDPTTLVQIRREFIGPGTNSLKVDKRTNLFYIGKKFDTELALYDPLALIPIDYLRAKGPVDYMTIDGDGNNLYLVTSGRRSVSVVALVSKKTLGEFDVGEDAYWVTMQGER
jgi:YVTN family beta-propeller protein